MGIGQIEKYIKGQSLIWNVFICYEKKLKIMEGSSQGSCMCKGPWTWTTGWGLTEGGSVGGARESNREKSRQV